MTDRQNLRVAGLFAGVGGLELGLHQAGHRTEVLCEIWPPARSVLRDQQAQGRPFSGARLLKRGAEALLPSAVGVDDSSRQAHAVPYSRAPFTENSVDLLAGGFPCQDLSQAGRTLGLFGNESRLILPVLDFLDRHPVKFLLIENVPFMLRLHKGATMREILRRLSKNYHWAYRVIDSRAFGLPQRRARVFLLATRKDLSISPASLLLADAIHPDLDPDADPTSLDPDGKYGFYWTEGSRGIGWTINAVPTLKGGSGLGIPSPPAVWIPSAPPGSKFVTPGLRDTVELQGFPREWLDSAIEAGNTRACWKLAGNAVSVPVAEWLGKMIAGEPRQPSGLFGPWSDSGSLPLAGFSDPDLGRGCMPPAWPSQWPMFRGLADLGLYLQASAPLSLRATVGFRSRLERSSLRGFPRARFLQDLREHEQHMTQALRRPQATP